MTQHPYTVKLLLVKLLLLIKTCKSFNTYDLSESHLYTNDELFLRMPRYLLFDRNLKKSFSL